MIKDCETHVMVNAVARAAEHPDTFNIPNIAERYSVQPGDYLKVAMESRDKGKPGERFWVKVKAIEELRIVALVANDLFFVPWKLDDQIMVAPEHIMDIVRAGE